MSFHPPRQKIQLLAELSDISCSEKKEASKKLARMVWPEKLVEVTMQHPIFCRMYTAWCIRMACETLLV